WNMSYLLFALAGGLTAAGGVGKAKQRTDLLQAALRTGGTNALFAFALSAIWGTLFSTEGVAMMLLAAAGGILSGLLVTALLPMVEVIFGYTTNIKLLELANLNNPLLKELAIRAPGTFHHSILVGNLVETAAESIRSNPLLARVGAYYHDVGKIKAPHYFAENQRPGQNPHDKLKPSMSALILKEHVRDGVKLLRTKGYPKILADICEQHVGTTLISFFYQKARNQASEKDEPPPLETDYRYPGPKPQTREAALVFLGDSVEAAAKSMSDPSPARLQGMVQKLISARFIDGQLSECNLTLGDLHNIARAFTRGLTGIYHFRPEYPEVKTSRRREDTGSNSRRSIQTAAVVNSRTSSRPATGPASSGGEAGAAPAREDAAPEERAESATPDAAAQAQPFQAGMSTVSVDELDSVGELASAEEDAFSQEGCGALSRLHDDIEDEARDDEQQTGRKGAGGGKAVRGPEGSRGGEERQDRPPGDEASGLRRLGCPRSG
ncbi:MAG: HDIG domain-containing protein, partial [Deltaproteobacteria bacterium]|nr:HDIG domain-containing protein [Deltaproteobacteria bacterium]